MEECSPMNMKRHKSQAVVIWMKRLDMELLAPLGGIIWEGRGGVSLTVDFEVSKAHTIPSLSQSLFQRLSECLSLPLFQLLLQFSVCLLACHQAL